MDALALYLWHLLRSRDESDSDEEEIELPDVKLPEITVVRRKEDVDGRKRKRVSFAEQVLKSSVMKNTEPIKASSVSPQYTLVPVCTDHDYTPSLVCSRQLPDGRQVRMGVEVKGIDHSGRDSENGNPNSKTTIQKPIMRKKQPLDPPEKSAVQKDVITEPNKFYRPVHSWNELLEQFDTKPEDGDKLFAKLIAALSDKEGESGVERESNSGDLTRVETLTNGNELDDDSDSVEIVWESSTPSAEEHSTTQAKQSEANASVNVYEELFDNCTEEAILINGTTCDLDKEDASAAQEFFCVIKESKGEPVDSKQNLDSSANIDVANSDSSIIENGDLDKYIIAVVGNVVEHPDILDVPFECIQQGNSTEEAAAVGELLNSSVFQSETEIQELEEFKNPSDQALTSGETHPGPQRKRSKKSTETSESERTDDQPFVKKKRPYKYRQSKLTPFEKLSKRALVTRLAREIRSSQDPLDMMDCEEFKNTFGFSKQFAEFLTTLLTPHLHKAMRIYGTSNHLKVLAALYFFTTGFASAEVGRVAHLSQPQTTRCLTDVIGALILSAPEPELPASDSAFDELYGLPNIIGAVDATHVPIKPPSGIGRKCPAKERFGNPKSYRNSANYFSINVEIVSSTSNRIMFCCSKLPATSTKSLMWQQSKVRDLVIARQADENSPDRFIAGSGYNCEPWMLTPCSATSHLSAQRYNTALTSALRDSICLTIGLLKGRFKCLSLASKQQCLNYPPAKACQVITACCVLHNLAMDFGEDIPDPVFDEFDTVETDVDECEINWDGLEARNNYIVEHFS